MSSFIILWVAYTVLLVAWSILAHALFNLRGFDYRHFLPPLVLTHMCWQLGGVALVEAIIYSPVRLAMMVFIG